MTKFKVTLETELGYIFVRDGTDRSELLAAKIKLQGSLEASHCNSAVQVSFLNNELGCSYEYGPGQYSASPKLKSESFVYYCDAMACALRLAKQDISADIVPMMKFLPADS